MDKLNGDLAWEYAALIQYVQHASAITGAAYESIIAELLVHANEEMQHAINLSDQIAFLGGVPAVDVEVIKTSPDSTEMLEQDLDGELDAIRRYKERIAEAESLQEYGLRHDHLLCSGMHQWILEKQQGRVTSLARLTRPCHKEEKGELGGHLWHLAHSQYSPIPNSRQ